jgi:DNA-binding response OmpR family regulator
MSKKILCIDDDPMIRSLVKDMLTPAGYDVTTVEDGQQGVELLEKDNQAQEFSLVLLDVIMPGMNGLDVLTRLKLHAKTQALPVIMLTGEDKTNDILAGYQTGAEYYITKPFDRKQLLYGINLVLTGEES